MSNVSVVHQPAESRFEARSGEEVVGHLSYETIGGTADLQHTVVEPDHQGEGIGEALVEEALREMRANRMTVRPSCSFVASYIEEHPEYQNLLAPGLEDEFSAGGDEAADAAAAGEDGGSSGSAADEQQ
ncbi:GNAT family N-acetyltransferase [Ornithinimicrobium sp. Y1847]|uniref:GNAT family N-acetyltransferase n=1 Tax=unclassified Ornithinimicrobium TaxID=2615080 RepID=UPI003B6729D2